MRTVGAAAAGVAVLGSLVPLGSGLLMMFAVDPMRYPMWPTGLAIGVALAPTSVGLALKMLKEARRLHAREGQLIMAAAFLDDVISLVLLTMLMEIGGAVSTGEDLAAWPVLRPLVLSSAFCALAVGLGLPSQPAVPARSGVWAYLTGWLGLVPRTVGILTSTRRAPPAPPGAMVALRRGRAPGSAGAAARPHAAADGGQSEGEVWCDAPELQPSTSHAPMPTNTQAPARTVPRAPPTAAGAEARFDRPSLLLLMIMLAALVGFSAVGDVVGSHLLGAFLAGVMFAAVPGALAVWHAQVKRIGAWLVRFFFGGTVAFEVPIRTMFEPHALVLGMLLCAGPACLGKLVGAAAAGWHDLAIVGAAMLGRGEFGFLVAETARALLLNPAPASFANHELALRLQRATSGGGWCIDGDCGDGVLAGAPGEPASFQVAKKWCAHCENGQCDVEPRFGVRYWLLGADCDAHPDACDCTSMMDADAFAISMWAIVGSSLLSPLLFRLALHRRARAEAAAAAARKPGGHVAGSGSADGAPQQRWLGVSHSPYLRADLMI